jgi:methyl acetate hydrolase
MTKAITGAAAMQLVERGKLKLDAPAKAVVPQLGEIGVLEGFDAAGKPKMRKPKRDITLRHLLTHTAGFGYDIWSPEVGKYMEAMEVPGVISCQNKALTTPLLFDPGERWFYGINIDWAGKMVEAASGKRLGQYMRDNILGPLGMDSTGFRITDGMRKRLAKIHHREPDGALTPDTALELPQEPEFEMGGGGLYSTAGDYLKFVRMMLNHGKSDKGEAVLKPETTAEMSKNAMGDATVCPLKTAAPPFSNDAEFFPGMRKQWGLSFMINNEAAPTGRSAGALAWAGLANTYYWIDQKKGVGGVYATQILPFVDVKALPLFYAFESAVYGK